MAFKMKQGDTLPDFERTLKLGSAAMNLTGATVFFMMKKKGFDPIVISQQMAVTSAQEGAVKHVWAAGSTDALEGDYIIECEARWAGGRTFTFPNDGEGEVVTFIKDIGDGA